jgi:hypothetical protein
LQQFLFSSQKIYFFPEITENYNSCSFLCVHYYFCLFFMWLLLQWSTVLMYFCVVPASSLTRKMTKHISPFLVASLSFHHDRQALLRCCSFPFCTPHSLSETNKQTFKNLFKQTNFFKKKTEKIRQKANKATNVHESCD